MITTLVFFARKKYASIMFYLLSVLRNLRCLYWKHIKYRGDNEAFKQQLMRDFGEHIRDQKIEDQRALVLSTSPIAICQELGIDYTKTQGFAFVTRLVHFKYDQHDVAVWNKLIREDKPRRAMFNYMVSEGDFREDIINFAPKGRLAFEQFLDT